MAAAVLLTAQQQVDEYPVLKSVCDASTDGKLPGCDLQANRTREKGAHFEFFVYFIDTPYYATVRQAHGLDPKVPGYCDVEWVICKQVHSLDELICELLRLRNMALAVQLFGVVEHTADFFTSDKEEQRLMRWSLGARTNSWPF